MQLSTNTSGKEFGIRVTDKELTVMYEIGLDMIPTATEFVESMSYKYQVSQSGVWYTIKKLKAAGFVDFAEKGEEHRPLTLTETGTKVIRSRVIDVEKRHYHYVSVAAVKSRA